ncbi:hypothetical protein KVR01_012654 [Diaporthe batatas]|uniref:uncharacterized protein n=1 Tax=Diaporthe batatas TaxID=748121 RepID=UPI001D03D51B|nr:uncharacterized protein KVR01_012654 [Diaporthe batatas]KAG8157612.1 hypothetical protein KVR01_012654 [Diaporthe batatas]
MPPHKDASGNTFIRHTSGQVTHYIVNDFTDPWKPRETVLLQHGFARNVEHWYHWVPPLARHFRVIRRDLRGHGLSSVPKNDGSYDYSLETILEEIVDMLDQLGIEKVHFLGESTSGMLGLAMAAQFPGRLLSLTICSTPTHLPPKALEMFAVGQKVSWPDACRILGSRGWAEALAKLPGTVGVDEDGYTAWWVDQVARSTGEGLAGYAEFLSHLDARPFLSRIKVPVLILAPRSSAVLTVPDMEQLARQIGASASLVVVDAPGHEIYVSGADQCQAAVLKFWKSLAASSGGQDE